MISLTDTRFVAIKDLRGSGISYPVDKVLEGKVGKCKQLCNHNCGGFYVHTENLLDEEVGW